MWQIWSHCHTTCDHGKKSALAKPDRGLKARLNAIVQYEKQGITQCVNESSQAKQCWYIVGLDYGCTAV